VSRVQILIEDDGNRTAVRHLADQRYTVVDERELVRTDCYVVDDQTLPTYREQLLEHKQEQHPTFCPVVLIRREDTHVSVDLGSPDESDEVQLIDETVGAPIDREVLFRRLDNLIVRRNQSLTLTRQYERSEARFEALFDAVPDPAFVLDQTDKIVEVNDEFCSVLGTDRTDVVGEQLSEVRQLGMDAEVIVKRVRADGVSPQTSVDTIMFTDREGRDRHATLSVQSVTVSSESLTVGVLTDITELQEKTERLEEFASVLAHDLRNPLQVAKTRTEITKQQFPDAAEHLDPVEESIYRMQDLITKLLTIARTGSDDQDWELLALRECAESAWETVATADSSLVVETDGATVTASEERLRELFENLFRNAIEHAGPDVTVTVGSLPDGFYVADDGPGIPEQKRDEIFQMGYSTLDSGNGLGMSIVAEIAKAHNWDIIVRDSAEGGARFEFTER